VHSGAGQGRSANTGCCPGLDCGLSTPGFLYPLPVLRFAKRKPAPEDKGEGSKIAIVLNGSPLFTGDAASGESNIRRWIIENDWLDAIAALPDQLFYNTGIYTYIWLVTTAASASSMTRPPHIGSPRASSSRTTSYP
jgi:hypothetical protein